VFERKAWKKGEEEKGYKEEEQEVKDPSSLSPPTLAILFEV
jgi:hypothetical protein